MRCVSWRFVPPLLRSLLFSVVVSLAARGATATTACVGDVNGDGVITIDDVVRTVNAALTECEPASRGGLLATGQAQCDAGSGTLGTCPGAPPGQDSAVSAGVPLSYSDNSDGTVRDNATGLVWEKLSAAADIHNWATAYTWSDAFSVKIAALNTAPCFAGHCDWRLPNRRELESLVDVGHSTPAIDAIFHSGGTSGCSAETSSCTQSDYYWSSTSYQDSNLAGFAWVVDFNFGSVDPYDKSLPAYYVRAVRGGL